MNRKRYQRLFVTKLQHREPNRITLSILPYQSRHQIHSTYSCCEAKVNKLFDPLLYFFFSFLTFFLVPSKSLSYYPRVVSHFCHRHPVPSKSLSYYPGVVSHFCHKTPTHPRVVLGDTFHGLTTLPPP